MLKVLVVFYSLTGNTKLIAEAIQKTANADILEIKPVKELKDEGSMKYFWGGFQAIMKKNPKLKPFDINPLEYDIIFIGSPVWAWRYTPPIHSFMKKYDLSGKNLALWMCSGGDGEKAMGRFKDALKSTNIIGDISFQEPLQKGSEEATENAIAWAKLIIENVKNN